jgi:hypothetical protein
MTQFGRLDGVLLNQHDRVTSDPKRSSLSQSAILSGMQKRGFMKSRESRQPPDFLVLSRCSRGADLNRRPM